MIELDPPLGSIFVNTDKTPEEEYIYIKGKDNKFKWKQIANANVLSDLISELSKDIDTLKAYDYIDPNSLVVIPE